MKEITEEKQVIYNAMKKFIMDAHMAGQTKAAAFSSPKSAMAYYLDHNNQKRMKVFIDIITQRKEDIKQLT